MAALTYTCGRRRRKSGEFEHAIERSRGGRTTKVHAMTDEAGQPRAEAKIATTIVWWLN